MSYEPGCMQLVLFYSCHILKCMISLGSFFDRISTFMGYLIPKPFIYTNGPYLSQGN